MLGTKSNGKRWVELAFQQLLDLEGEGILWPVELGKPHSVLGMQSSQPGSPSASPASSPHLGGMA